LNNDHDDPGAITTSTLKSAAEMTGTSIPSVVSNLVMALGEFTGEVSKQSDAIETPYAACHVLKASEERRFTLGVAYPANKPDATKAADGHRDFVSAEVLEKTAHEWLHKYRDVNLFHKDGTSGHFTPAESYIWRFPDWEIRSPVDNQTYVVKAGDWLLGGYWDEYGWELVKAGLVNGWSPEGTAKRKMPSPERLAQLRVS
jgi:hypothetical protein